jgi:2-haloacid dehalogenase
MANAHFNDIGACVFDAYGTLFDFNSAVERCRDKLGDKADALSATWRQKQLQYTWLRSLMGKYEDFWAVTGNALDFALAAADVDDPPLRAELMQLYLELDPYAEVVETLTKLKDARIKTAILSNGSMSMLVSAVKSAGVGNLIDSILSVDEVEIFKPHPSVYQLAVDKLDVAAHRISFQSSNAWDACGAASFGFRVAWINRFGQPREELPGTPHAELRSLTELPQLIGL